MSNLSALVAAFPDHGKPFYAHARFQYADRLDFVARRLTTGWPTDPIARVAVLLDGRLRGCEHPHLGVAGMTAVQRKRNEERRIQVLVADDHPVYRQGLAEAIKRRPELELAGQAGCGRSALAEIRRLRPDVAVIDMKMPELDGMEIARAVSQDELTSRILFLTGFLEGAIAYEAVEAGARGYISKDSSSETICDAIAAVARDEIVMGTEVQGSIATEIRSRAPAEKSVLSEREREIVELVADGHSVSEIASRLYLSPATVKTHLQRVYQKLGVSDRAAAVAEAMRRGIVE
jgi:two-component system nitrate/nitrite response regulator NarL